MRLQNLLSVGLLAFVAACAASGVSSGDPNGAPGGAGSTSGDAESTTLPEDDDTPHALGTIVLGETRSSQTGDSSPVISASFVPDSKQSKACTSKIGACELAEVPRCMTGTAQGCSSNELCTFDDACKPKCVKACTKACGAGEQCVFSSNVASEAGMACKRKERFDAGAIAFAGTTTPITLFPPYGVTPDGNGAPFMARSEIRVQASGAAEAGFEKFDEKFTSTTFLETNPPLRELTRATVFGSSGVSIGWVPGEDSVVITASGPMGAAKCTAKDQDGEYLLPREVIREVMGGTDTGSGLTLTVTRERREVRRDKKALGSPHERAYLELVTSSSESHAFASCATGYSLCGDECVDTRNDSQNCGSCGKTCFSTQYCSYGLCR
jgi:hypothetical protein